MVIKSKIKIRVECEDTVIVANDNTTIGYATMDTSVGKLTYIFVHPAFRRRGIGAMLVLAAEKAAGQSLRPADPISPLGLLFFKQQFNRYFQNEGSFDKANTLFLQYVNL